jgi:hypothetical protein
MNNMRKQPVYIRLLIAGGLLMTTMPLLFKDYVHIPDFVRGFLAGAGLVFEIAGIVLMKRRQKAGIVSCR